MSDGFKHEHGIEMRVVARKFTEILNIEGFSASAGILGFMLAMAYEIGM